MKNFDFDLGVGKDNIQKCWEYLKLNVTKEVVEKKAKEIKEYYPNAHDEKWIYGFAVNQVIANIFGGGECESLIRIENDLAKFLGYTFSTQLDDLERNGFKNNISPLV